MTRMMSRFTMQLIALVLAGTITGTSPARAEAPQEMAVSFTTEITVTVGPVSTTRGREAVAWLKRQETSKEQCPKDAFEYGRMKEYHRLDEQAWFRHLDADCGGKRRQWQQEQDALHAEVARRDAELAGMYAEIGVAYVPVKQQ